MKNDRVRTSSGLKQISLSLLLSTLLLPAMAQLPKDVLQQKNQNWSNIKNKGQGDARQPPVLIDDSGMKPKQPPMIVDDGVMGPKPPILIDDSGMKPKEQSPTFSEDHRYRGEMNNPTVSEDHRYRGEMNNPTVSGDHRYHGEMGTPKPAINVFPSGK